MDAELKKQLTTDNGKLIELADYDVKVGYDDGNPTHITAIFYKKGKDRWDNYSNKFSDDDVGALIKDLKDLSDWRHFRRLKNKLNSPDN